jgi:erythromycin esterase-like protein
MFWRQVLVNVVQAARRRLGMHDQPGMVPRDRQMAENLIWMAKDYYPSRKIVVWCASAHALRSPGRLAANGYGLKTTLGDYVWKAFGQEMYSIAPVSYEGSFSGDGEFTVLADQLPEAEFEELMAVTGQTAALVDLR